MAEWKYRFEGEDFGPFEPARMRELARVGVVRPGILVWRSGMRDWLPYQAIAHELERPVREEPALAQVQQPPQAPDHARDKDKPAAPEADSVARISPAAAAADQPPKAKRETAAPADPLFNVPTGNGQPGSTGSAAETRSEASIPVPPRPTTPPTDRFRLASPRRASGGYVGRHWRGQLDLARAFWVNGVALTLVLAALFFYVVAPFARTIGRDGLIVLGLITVVIAVWQLVGLWRAAGQRLRQGATGTLAAVGARAYVVAVGAGCLALVGFFLG